MSSRTRTVTRETSTGSHKRKSIDKADEENLSPNQEPAEEKITAKKSRVLRSSSSIQAEANVSTNVQEKSSAKTSFSSTVMKARSALPRYASTKPVSLAESKRRAATEKTTAERAAPATPIREKSLISSPPRSVSSVSTPRTTGRASLSKTTANRRKSTRKSILKINGGRIKNFFETCSLIGEEKLNETIIPKLRVKCKWDYRDKANRQTEVITDLKTAYKQNLIEVKSLQEKCESEEKILQELIYDLRQELQEALQQNAELKRNETQLKKDFARISNDYNSSNSKLKALEKELPSLIRELEFLKQKSDETETELNSVSQTLATKETLLAQLSSQLQTVTQEKDTLASTMKDQVETATEKFRQDILQLRVELEKRQYDVEKTSAEREDMQEKVETHKEIVMRLESKLRESEAMGQRLEKEESKLSNEVMELKAQLTQKDTDLRMTLSSMQEYQRNFSEERSTLRSDLSGLQSRLSQLEEQRVEDKFEVATKREELQNSIKEIASLKETLASVQNALAEREKELVESRASMMQLGIEKEMRMRSEMREESERNERISACAQLLATQYDCANRLKESDEKFKSSVESLQEQIGESKLRWETECSNNQMLIEKIAILEGEINQYKHALENAHANANYEAVAELGRVKGEVEVLRKRISELNEHKHAEGNAATHRIRELETQLAEKDVQRRKLHNLVQELRGNVRVFARVRPFLPDDESYDPTAPPESSITTRHDNCGLRITKKVLKSATDKPEDHTFTFDKVFGQSASQEIVFQEVSEFVQSALDGYHVCLFSYGQTGSGKTYTMQGSGDGPMRGIIPRAIQQVGLYKLSQEEKGWEYEMEVSFIEIYNETIRDLLREDSDSNLKHEIKKDASGNTFVSDVAMLSLDPNDGNRVDEILHLAARHRSVGQTSMNAQSSRSHSIFTLHLKAKNIVDGIVLRGALNLVDLAGSERLDRSGATGSQMRETLAINKSLSSLTDVFVAIASKQAHIPFRNSKLTHLLQPALSGEGKALMMVNLSPTDQSYYESLCSLRFASQVNQCELGKPKRFLKEANANANSNAGSSSSATTSSSGIPVVSKTTSSSSTLTKSTSSISRLASSTKPSTPSRPTKTTRLK